MSHASGEAYRGYEIACLPWCGWAVFWPEGDLYEAATSRSDARGIIDRLCDGPPQGVLPV